MRTFVAMLAFLAACAGPRAQPQAPAQPDGFESLLPGTIGIVVRQAAQGVVVSAVKEGGAARAAGVRRGDVIVRYNGIPVGNPRAFNRLVAASRPGDTAALELLRQGALRRVEVPVRQLDTTPRS